MEDGVVSAELWELGCTGIEERSDGLVAYFEDATGSELVQRQFSGGTISLDLPAVVIHEANDRDPVLVGKRFVIVPSGRIVLPIDAAMAFGSGSHETTQLCLLALERLVQKDAIVFDVGCGSGILALAAQKLGATRVFAADIDEASIVVARSHFAGPVIAGSADSFASRSADLVISNITGKVNDRLAGELKRITKPTGRVVISGFTANTAPCNFDPEEVLQEGDWLCWICNPACIINAEAGEHEIRWWM